MPPKIAALLAVAGLVTGCRHRDEQSTVKFIELGPTQVGIAAKLNAPKLRICLAGASVDQWGGPIQRALQEWVRAAQQATSVRLATEVEVVAARDSGACDLATHARVVFNNSSGRAHALPYHYPSIYMFSRNASYPVLLHEFGHALGLGDTYVEGVWNCRPGQPDSVMCKATYESLQADDRAGIQTVVRRLFGEIEGHTIPPAVCVLYERDGLRSKLGCVDNAIAKPTRSLVVDRDTCRDANGPRLFGDDWDQDQWRTRFVVAANCSDLSIPEKGDQSVSSDDASPSASSGDERPTDDTPAAGGACARYGGGASDGRLGRNFCIDPTRSRVAISARTCTLANEANLFGGPSSALRKLVRYFPGQSCETVPDFQPAP